MKLIVGLGNPGAQYEGTRHNAGFIAIDNFATKHNAKFKVEAKLKGMLAQVIINGQKALLLKPTTFMNLSGESVNEVVKYYKIAVEDIMVIVDDLSLPTGKVRLRANGSSGGHNGLKSINSLLKTEDYKRIRIGIDRSSVIPVIDYVLGRFSKDDRILIDEACDKTSRMIEDFISNVPFETILSTQ